MTIEQAREYNLPERGAVNAFEIVNDKHSEILGLDDLEDRDDVVRDYLYAAIGYFANNTDSYLNEVGTIAWRALETGRVELKIASDTHKGLEELGLKFDPNKVGKGEQFLATVIYEDPFDTTNLVPRTTLIIPRSMVFSARFDPIDTLDGTIVTIAGIRDVLNHRYSNDDVNKIRSQATEAQFYLGVQDQIRGTSLTPSPRMQEMLGAYPEGVMTPGLPAKVLFKSRRI